ncbi:hypothetical protein SynA1825c_00905 [Synechococcus sp. A18-25c]|nr:hypothetical protein SynA1825c_00905 [Synechococcus sp. A18-25c]
MDIGNCCYQRVRQSLRENSTAKTSFFESTNGFIKNIKLLTAGNRCLVLPERFN